ncbi:hypothetical protein [Micromonospora craniellae]|uniref:Uncharacterized protein n=1 Tax=Micromonospora craniellae TaxID=2294034 RepID=A0A372FW67_9ACTN|nr:hypothetical protein [Micromonospora craniellae]QOC93596.1 hypothetical protein ID554_08155 [Micromonospora craniellae]RFS45015.1 hypothetical protein D0Q02_19380 [Micromonospora craniellae]
MNHADDQRTASVGPRRAALPRRLTARELETFLVSGTALVVGLLGLLDVTGPKVVAAATLAVLGVITFELLTGHRRLRRIESGLRSVAGGLSGDSVSSMDRVLTVAVPGGVTPMVNARDIRLVGVSLSRTVRNHLDELRQQLLAGATVRVALIDPASSAPEEAARRNGLGAAAGGNIFAHRIQPTIDLLDYLATETGGAGRLEVRLLRFVPAFGMVLVDPTEPTGRISLDIYSHRPDGREATVTLRAERDPIWYHHFLQEFDRVWAGGRVQDGRPLL